MSKLKPCPFCGSKPICEEHGDVTSPNWGVAIRCSNMTQCGCRFEFRGTYTEAIEAWNRRVKNERKTM